MSKERLEEIKMKTNNTTEPMLYVPYSDFKWLIEQAEQEHATSVQNTKLAVEFERLQLENKRHHEALEFYADKSIYNFETETDFDAEETRIINEGHIFRDFGEKARKALSK